jgi:hypothetical protein
MAARRRARKRHQQPNTLSAAEQLLQDARTRRQESARRGHATRAERRAAQTAPPEPTPEQQAANRRQDAARRAWDRRRANAEEARRAAAPTTPKTAIPHSTTVPGHNIKSSTTEPDVKDLHVRATTGLSKEEFEKATHGMVADYPTKFHVTIAHPKIITGHRARPGRRISDPIYTPDHSKLIVSFLGDDGTRINRRFHKNGETGEKSVYHAFFRAGKTGEGSAKALFRNSMKLYDRIGVKKITVTANIDVGGYAWGRFGFEPTPNEWPSISRDLVGFTGFKHHPGKIDKLDVPQDVKDHLKSLVAKKDFHALIDSRHGHENLGKKLFLGTSWSGVLDLTNPKHLERMRAYINK